MKALDIFKRFLSGLAIVLRSPEAQILEKTIKVSPQAQIAIAAVEAADEVINKPESGPESPMEPRSQEPAASPLPDA